MTPRIDNRMYTNMVLTVIAVVLIAMAAQQLGINVLGSVNAQGKYTPPDLTKTATGAVIDSTIPQTQDVAVAQATMEVANSNREIALAIRELAEAVKEGTSGLRSAMTNNAVAPAATGSSSTATPVEAAPRPVIEVR